MTERVTEDGERIGYIDLCDSAKRETVSAPNFDDPEFVTETETLILAAQRG